MPSAQELFLDIGPLLSTEIHYDKSGRSMGEGSVIFEDRTDAIRAINQYRGVPLDGNECLVLHTSLKDSFFVYLRFVENITLPFGLPTPYFIHYCLFYISSLFFCNPVSQILVVFRCWLILQRIKSKIQPKSITSVGNWENTTKSFDVSMILSFENLLSQGLFFDYRTYKLQKVMRS